MPELTNERLAEIETLLHIEERPVRDVAPAVHDAAVDLIDEVRRLRAENERLRAERLTADERDVQGWETPCQARDDQQHCNCWYDGEACCACGDSPWVDSAAVVPLRGVPRMCPECPALPILCPLCARRFAMPELTNERLAEIEARAVEVASRDHLKATRISDEWIAHHARTDIPDIIAALRELQAENERLRAERLTPDDYETILGALDDEIGEERNMAQGYEDGSPRFLDHIASMERVFAVKAKIEAMRDGGEG